MRNKIKQLEHITTENGFMMDDLSENEQEPNLYLFNLFIQNHPRVFLLYSVMEVPCTVTSSYTCNCSVCKIYCNTDWEETRREGILHLLLYYYYYNALISLKEFLAVICTMCFLIADYFVCPRSTY